MRLVCDWHGTFVVSDDMGKVFNRIALCALAWRLSRSPFRAFREFNLGRRLRTESKTNKDIGRSVEIFNSIFGTVISRRTATRIVENTARRNIQTLMLNKPIAQPLLAFRGIFEERVLLSSGLRPLILELLSGLGIANYFDTVIANDFEPHSGSLRLVVLRNKLRILKELMGPSLSDVVFVGDSLNDEAAIRHVGFPVVSNLASQTFKNRLERDKSAHVVRSSAEFAEFLKSIGSRPVRELAEGG